MGFVDIHSHVLHGLDDGAHTLEQSLSMLRIAADQGTTAIVATPHANSQYAFNPEVIEQRLAELRETSVVELYPGCDFHLQADNILDALAHPDKYAINHRTYLLVEFPWQHPLHGATDILRRLAEAGLAPIITHPERNAHLYRSFDLLVDLVQMGCYVQVTAGSFLGEFGREARSSARALLRRRLVHFVASDAHGPVKRPPGLQDAYHKLVDEYGEAAIRPLFVDNPRAVIEGTRFDFRMPRSPRSRKRWFYFR